MSKMRCRISKDPKYDHVKNQSSSIAADELGIYFWVTGVVSDGFFCTKNE